MELIESSARTDPRSGPDLMLDQLVGLAQSGLFQAARDYGRDLDPGFPAYATRFITAQPGWVDLCRDR